MFWSFWKENMLIENVDVKVSGQKTLWRERIHNRRNEEKMSVCDQTIRNKLDEKVGLYTESINYS